MWSISKLLSLIVILNLTVSRYLQFQLVRMAPSKQGDKLDPIQCKSEEQINQDADYREVCYEKDIAYVIPFVYNNSISMISADFTTPISWLKGPDCTIEGTTKLCTHLRSSITQKAKLTKKQLAKKWHAAKKKKQSQKKEDKDSSEDKDDDSDDTQKEDAIIEGSSEVIRGEFEKAKSLTFAIKDSNRLNNFFELIMLGLFILGERDTVIMEDANFIDATSISANLNSRSDGAISLRFDDSSENSFLNEIWSYVKAKQKTVTVYLGVNNTLTIGDLTSKYTKSGYSSIQWIDMPDNEGLGKMPEISDIGIEDMTEDEEEDTDQTLPAVLTLSASYIGLPESVFADVFSKSISKIATCQFNNKTLYAECTFNNKKSHDKLLQKNVYYSFGGKNMVIPLKHLILHSEGKKITFNMKKTSTNHAILGEPIFRHYYCLFDYSKNRIGFAERRQTFHQFFISVVALVRFLCFVFVLGCSFIICYGPCRKMIRTFAEKRWYKRGQGREGQRLKQYQPIQENPYDDLKGKIQDAINSTQRDDVEGI